MNKYRFVRHVFISMFVVIGLQGCFNSEPSASDINASLSEAYSCDQDIFDLIKIKNIVPNDENTKYIDFEFSVLFKPTQSIKDAIAKANDEALNTGLNDLRRDYALMYDEIIKIKNPLMAEVEQRKNEISGGKESVLILELKRSTDSDISSIRSKWEDKRRDYQRNYDEDMKALKQEMNEAFAAIDREYEPRLNEIRLEVKKAVFTDRHRSALDHFYALEDEIDNRKKAIREEYKSKGSLRWDEYRDWHNNVSKWIQLDIDEIKAKKQSEINHLQQVVNKYLADIDKDFEPRFIKLNEMIIKNEERSREIDELVEEHNLHINNLKKMLENTPLKSCYRSTIVKSGALISSDGLNISVDDDLAYAIAKESGMILNKLTSDSKFKEYSSSLSAKVLMIKTSNGWRFYDYSVR